MEPLQQRGVQSCQYCGCGGSDHLVVVGFQGQLKSQDSLDSLISGSLQRFHGSCGILGTVCPTTPRWSHMLDNDLAYLESIKASWPWDVFMLEC